MRCLECGKQFVLLANHVRKTHKIDPDDYRRKHNILLTTALADDELREHLSAKAKQRLRTKEGMNHLRTMLALSDRQAQTGQKLNLPPISVAHCHANNAKKSQTFRELKLPALLPDWLSGVVNRDIAIKHGIATVTLRKWVQQGHLPKRKLQYVVIK